MFSLCKLFLHFYCPSFVLFYSFSNTSVVFILVFVSTHSDTFVYFTRTISRIYLPYLLLQLADILFNQPFTEVPIKCSFIPPWNPPGLGDRRAMEEVCRGWLNLHEWCTPVYLMHVGYPPTRTVFVICADRSACSERDERLIPIQIHVQCCNGHW